MKQPKLWLALAGQLITFSIFAQISFTNKADLLTPAQHFSGVAIAVIDANGDGLDDIVRMDQGILPNIQYQTAANQPFTAKNLDALPLEDGSQWGMCTADVDNNGYADILTGGFYDGVKIASASNDGSTFTYANLTQPSTFTQGVNFADINNDGWLDAFVCHDDGVARMYGNNGDGTFTYQPMWMNLATVPASDNSGNYGSVWSDIDNDGDLDLYIAHCRQGVSSNTDPRRINQLFLNNGDGTYTQDVANNSGLRIGAQSWTADFGDIDNDGDFDCFITNHDVSSQVLLNDGAGHFTDITAAAGMLNAIQGSPIQGVFRDFDNDGYVDILAAGTYQYVFRNNGDNTFTKVTGIFDNHNMESFAVGDLNHDGFQDIYGGYAYIYTTPSTVPDALWINDGNSNHFFGMSLRGVQSNRSAVGAKVQLVSSLGIQTREVRAGESYGISNSLQIHFGLGQVETIDSVVISWPSGKRDVLYNPARDQYINFTEGGCTIASISLNALGATTFCTGQSVDIEAPEGYTYLWNTGDTLQRITATVAGDYKVTVTSPEGCSATSNTIIVTTDPIEIPTISVLGDTVFCAGGSVLLTASEAGSYLWSNGATTSSVTVSESGNYSVTTQGLCAAFSSTAQGVHVLNAAPPTDLTGDHVYIDSIATISAAGEHIKWYETETSTDPLFTGNEFVTPGLPANTTYWVSNSTSYDNPNDYVGMKYHAGATTFDQTYNGGLYFDCFEPVTLSRVKVYAAKAGERTIVLRDVNNNVLQSKVVNIPLDSSYVDLGFQLPVGSDFLLSTDQDANFTVFGSASPQLRRSNAGCAFPYNIDNVISIKNSTFNLERYYYFYDWEIDYPGVTCESERFPVEVVVSPLSNTNSPEWANDIKLFPNPTAGGLQVSIANYVGGTLNVSVKNIQGITVQTQSISGATGKLQFNANLGQLAKGVYWMEFSGENGVVRRKIILQ